LAGAAQGIFSPADLVVPVQVRELALVAARMPVDLGI